MRFFGWLGAFRLPPMPRPAMPPRWQRGLTDDPRLSAMVGYLVGCFAGICGGEVFSGRLPWPVVVLQVLMVGATLRWALPRFLKLREALEPRPETDGGGRHGWDSERRLYVLPKDPEFLRRLELVLFGREEHSGTPTVQPGAVGDTDGATELASADEAAS